MAQGLNVDAPVGGDDARYRLLVEAITDYAIYMLDPSGRVTSWNAGAQRFKGYTPVEIIGQHFSRFYTEEDRAAGVPARALRTAAEEGGYETEGWRVRQDGERFWAHVLIDPIRTPAGELVGYAKITRDLSERRAAEESLRRSEEQFRLLVQGVTDYAIYMLDRDGQVSSWNAGAQRIKGYLPAEIIGDHFSRFYTEGDREAGEPARALATAMAEGRFEKEGWRVRKDGSRFWAHVVLDAIHDDAGEVIGFAKVTRDITERMEAQRALEQARQTLMQAQKLDALGQLTGGVAHDFNNLLMAVLGSLELLRKRLPPDPRARALLENAVQGAERGAALTQRMLAFARKQELALEGVDTATLVRGITGLMERSLGPSVRLVTRFPRSLPPAITDANQLEAALLNLAVNARDAMPGGGQITIEAQAVAVPRDSDTGLPPGGYVRLSITDEGTGMDPQTLARASEPFFTTKGIGKGTGLGLSMVHGLAEQSGGRMMISSEPGRGTRVELWLPEADAVGEPKPALPGSEAEAGAEPCVVLAVDDDPLVLLNTTAMLEDLGHTVISAASAEEALAALRAGAVDLVITDHAMPEMTGHQLALEIRRTQPELPVVLATGYAELPPEVDANLPRLAKPYSQAELARVVRRAFPGGGGAKGQQ
jgi:PAS domain S-box-containing protein